MIEVKSLFHDYEGKGSFAVSDISFGIGMGEVFGFLGPSGAGKSTVQNIMTGLLRIQQGEVYYNGQEIRRLRRGFFNSIGYSFEHPNLYSKLTGFENLKFFANLFTCETEDPLRLLELVGLSGSAHKRAGRYSKGMKQRLVFARSIINKPQILFLDEPLSGLDPSNAEVIKGIIRKLQSDGCTILLTTHNMHAADELCDKVAFLNDGKIVALDSPRNLKLRYGESGLRVEFRRDKAEQVGGKGEQDGGKGEQNGDNGEQGSGQIESRVFDLSKPQDKADFDQIIASGQVETVHSQEASLEGIFQLLTGRKLKA